MIKRIFLNIPLCLGMVAFLGMSTSIASPQKREHKQLFQHKVKAGQTHKGLKQVSKRLTAIKVLRAGFKQHKKLKALRFPLRSTGHFLFVNGKGIFWQLQKPFPAQFRITAKGITQKAAGQVTHIDGKNKPIIFGFTRMFLSIFGGDQKQLQRHFQVYFMGQPKAWRIGLVPKDKLLHRIFKHIVLSGNKTIQRVDMLERSGDRTKIEFNDIKTTPPTLTPQEKARFR